MNVRDLSESALEANLKGLLGHERKTLVRFLHHLGELDRRRLYERNGYGSMWQYCRRELRLSESQAFYRCCVARLMRKFPVIAEYIEDGRLCMTILVQLREVLTADNVTSILDLAIGKSRDEVAAYVASLSPTPAPVATIVRALPPPAALAPPAFLRSSSPAADPSTPIELPILALVSGSTPAALPAATVPMSADQFRIHFTADKAFMDKLDRAKSVASHAIPDGDLRKLLERGLDMILAAAAKRHDPKAVKPRTAHRRPARLGNRRISRELERQVRERDGHCCSWKTSSGVCGSKWQLEIDHILPVAMGGKTELGNLRLVCREHNQMAARQAFGEEFIASKIADRGRARDLEQSVESSPPAGPRAAVF